MDSTSSLHQVFKAIKLRKAWFETHTFQPWKNGMNEKHGATNGILFCREWNPWQSTTWICMAVGCCFGKSDPNIWTPQMVVQYDHVNPILESIKKHLNLKNTHPSTVVPFWFQLFCPVFFLLSPAPPNTFSSELRSEPSCTTSPGTGGSPRNSW